MGKILAGGIATTDFSVVAMPCLWDTGELALRRMNRGKMVPKKHQAELTHNSFLAHLHFNGKSGKSVGVVW